MIYLDHNATTPIHPQVLESMLPFLKGNFGNPSSFYHIGRVSRTALENSRSTVAALIGAEPEEIIFTGSGTESNNLAIKGAAYALQDRGDHIITSSIEHPAVLNTVSALEKQGFRVSFIPVDQNGVVDPDDVKRLITSKTILVSVMQVNNETGVIQPVEDIGRIAGENGIVFHCDAIQGSGKIPLNVDVINADLISLSAHKVYGPKGTGALYVRTGTPIYSLISGGRQEHGMRAGTENIAGIAGFAKALQVTLSTMEQDCRYVAELRDMLEQGIRTRIQNIRINGCNAGRVCNTSSISFLSIEAESILLHMDLMKIYASSGSACTTGSSDPSHVLLSMGLDGQEARSTIRFSLGPDNTRQEIEKTVDGLFEITERLRRLSSLS